MTHDQELRKQALELAIGSRFTGASVAARPGDFVLEIAQKYYDFLTGKTNNEETK